MMIDRRYPRWEEYVFPPPGTLCFGSDRNFLRVRLPNGAGLLTNNYTLEVDVFNPDYDVDRKNNTWSMVTAVRNQEKQQIVDANLAFDGFSLKEMMPVLED